MIGLVVLAAAVSLPCDRLPTRSEQDACSVARQQFICWTRESERIDDHDPALLLFWEREEGESIENAKVDLAYERVNGCDPEPRQ